MEYPIPFKSSHAYLVYRKLSQAILNAGLVFERYAPTNTGSESKKAGLNQAVEAIKKADLKLLKSQAVRWKQSAVAIHAIPFGLKTDWRLVAGFGHKGPLEVGFTFNRYGFPVLPGSSLKGIDRAFALISLAEMLPTQQLALLEEVLLKTEEEFSLAWNQNYPSAPAVAQKMAGKFRTIFGTTDVTGRAIFLDSIPGGDELPKLEMDVMTPHYNQYYQRNEAPTDDCDPVPIPFLTVAAQTSFLFAVGWLTKPDMEEKSYQDSAVEWLKDGLQQLGAGAKTNAGYGLFAPNEDGVENPPPRNTPSIPAGYRRGTVLSFGEGPHQSFGYIKTENGEQIFVHKGFLAEGLTDLQLGQKVYFKVEFEKGKPQARDVHVETGS
jgi:CRISPR-associated protein Cmr6